MLTTFKQFPDSDQQVAFDLNDVKIVRQTQDGLAVILKGQEDYTINIYPNLSVEEFVEVVNEAKVEQDPAFKISNVMADFFSKIQGTEGSPFPDFEEKADGPEDLG